MSLRLRVLTAAADTIARALCWALNHHDRRITRWANDTQGDPA